MKKIISAFLTLILLASFVSCGAPAEPVVISPGEYPALNNAHLSDLLTGMVLSQGWQSVDEVEADRLVYYYVAVSLHKDQNASDRWTDGFIPADELEAAILARFDVTVEHLHTSGFYNAGNNAYEVGGIGSVGETMITEATIADNLFSIDYEIIGAMDYAEARGTLAMEVSDGDIMGDDVKFLSNELEWSAQHELRFPSAMDEVDYSGVFMMDSYGYSGTSEDGVNYKYYDGEDLDSIISFYEDEALPALEAEGSADLTKYGDGWYWSGSYRGGTPLVIDVQRKFGAGTYIIAALYDGSENAYIADNMRERDFMLPPDLNDSSAMRQFYGPLFYAGILDTTWSTASNVEVPGLVTLYAERIYTEEEPASSFAADDLERYVQRYFDIDAETMRGSNRYDEANKIYAYTPAERTEAVNIVSALTYGREYEDGDDSPIRIVIAYEVTPSDEDKAVLWSGELEVELSSGGYQYHSNTKVYPQYPITQDMDYLDELTEKYVNPIRDMYGISVTPWTMSMEIPADDLVNFCAFNNLLNMPRLSENDDTFVDNHAPAEATEAAIMQYFDVTAEYLRTSRWYNFVDDSGESYENEYIMLHGFGGGGMTRALHAEQDGNLLKITVGLFGPDDELPDHPQQLRLLTIELSDDGGYQYISNEIQNWPTIIE